MYSPFFFSFFVVGYCIAPYAHICDMRIWEDTTCVVFPLSKRCHLTEKRKEKGKGFSHGIARVLLLAKDSPCKQLAHPISIKRWYSSFFACTRWDSHECQRPWTVHPLQGCLFPMLGYSVFNVRISSSAESRSCLFLLCLLSQVRFSFRCCSLSIARIVYHALHDLPIS